MKKIYFLFVVLTSLFTFSIHGQNFVNINKSNSGTTINLASNQVLEISLPTNPSSGYDWYAMSPDKIKILKLLYKQAIGNFTY